MFVDLLLCKRTLVVSLTGRCGGKVLVDCTLFYCLAFSNKLAIGALETVLILKVVECVASSIAVVVLNYCRQ